MLELPNRENLLERWTHQRTKLPRQRRVNSIWNTWFLYPFCLLQHLWLSVAENILVSVAIVVDRRLRRPSNGYLLSLALTDICISFGLIPLEMTYHWSYPEWPLGPRETNVFSSVLLFSIAGSFVTVLVITVDRYRAVSDSSPVVFIQEIPTQRERGTEKGSARWDG